MGTGRTAAPGPAAHALDGQFGSRSPRRATALRLPQGPGGTESELNTARLDWMETGGLFSTRFASLERTPAVAGSPSPPARSRLPSAPSAA